MLFWPVLVKKMYPPPPYVAGSTNGVANATNQALANGTTGTNSRVPAAASIPQLATSVALPEAKFVVHGEVPEQLLVVTNNEARYTFTSRGGGLKEVQLPRYPETVSSRRQKKGQPINDLATLNAPNVPPVFAILGDESLQGDGVYQLTRTTNGGMPGVRAEKTLANGVTVVKDFQSGSNYLLTASVKFENQSKQAVVIPSQQWVAGTATPMGPQDNGMAVTVFWYNGSKADSVVMPYFNTNTSSFFGLFSRTPQSQYVAGSSNVFWASAQNQFFTLAMMPQHPAEAITVHMVDLPSPSQEEIRENPRTILTPKGLQASLIYPGLQLQPGQTVTNNFTLFAGPKEYQTLARLAARFNNDIDLIMSFGWFGPISKALLVTMNWLHNSLTLPYGWIIIFITIIIKLIFWPLTQASVRSAKRMQALQPQLKALQEKYKDEPQKFTAKQWEFYKKNKVNPLSGCLPMLLQVPVFIGFYGMLRSAIELRGAPFLWIGDLSKPDTIFSIPILLHTLGFGDMFIPVNPMPLIMGATLLWQASMTPPSPSMDASQQKIMKYMPLMMLVFMYNLSSGLALYWTVSNLLTVLQTKLTKPQANVVTVEPAKVIAPQKKKN